MYLNAHTAKKGLWKRGSYCNINRTHTGENPFKCKMHEEAMVLLQKNDVLQKSLKAMLAVI